MPQRMKKKMAVWRKKPVAVGHPPMSAIVNNQPKTLSVILKVSGLATRKKTRVE